MNLSPAARLAARTVLSAAVLGLMPFGARAQQTYELPAEKRGKYFYVRAKAQDKDLTLVIDSGAGAHVLTLDAARRLGLLKLNPEAPAVRAIGTADSVSVQRIALGEMRVGGAKLDEGFAIAVPLPAALEADGLLGFDLFRQYVVTLDYAKGKVTLAPPKDFKPAPDAVALPLRIERRLPQVEVEVDGVKGWVEVDTGSNGSLDLNTPFVEKNKLRGKYPARLEVPTGRGVGGVSYGDVARAEKLTLGPFAFSRPLVELSRQTTGADAGDDAGGRIGAEILSRFTVTFDYSRGHLYLTKNAEYDRPFVYNRSGLYVDKADLYYEVIHVLPGSPGAQAGVAVGDQVMAVGGVPVSRLKPMAMAETWRAAPGTVVTLTVRPKTGGAAREVTLTLRDVL